jgi:O-antigen/teichoic acid export membrane protein
MKMFLPLDRAAVGHYQAGIVLANMPYYLLTATIPILFTQIARVKNIGRTGPIVADSLRLALLVMLPIEALLVAFPAVFLHTLFPPAYLAGAPTLRILAVANAAIILVAVFSTAFQASGNPGLPGRVLLGIGAVEAAVLWTIVPVWHGVGASLTFLAAALTALMTLAVSYGRKLESLPVQRVLHWMARYVLAIVTGVAACAFALWASGNVAIAMAVAAAGYAVAVLALQLFSVRGILTRPATPRPITTVGEE